MSASPSPAPAPASWWPAPPVLVGEPLRLWVSGCPVAQPRARINTQGDSPGGFTDPGHAVIGWRGGLVAAALEARPAGWSLEGPFALVVHFVVLAPRKLLARVAAAPAGTYWVAVRPDLDNYWKAVADALNRRLYADDGQVAISDARKTYTAHAAEQGVAVTLSRLALPEPPPRRRRTGRARTIY